MIIHSVTHCVTACNVTITPELNTLSLLIENVELYNYAKHLGVDVEFSDLNREMVSLVLKPLLFETPFY
jgi:hypothetical protein